MNKTIRLLLSIVISFITLGVFVGASELLPESMKIVLLTDESLGLIFTTVFRALLAMVLLIVYRKIYRQDVGIRTENLSKGVFRYGLIVICAFIFQMAANYQKPEIGIVSALPELLLYFVSVMSVGLFEEMLCRGMLFNAFRDRFGDSKKGIYLSALLSSMLFGLFHLVNLVSYPDLVIATIAQVIYATFFGFIFCVIYFRSKNILACIILHGLFDFADRFWLYFVNNRAEQTAVSEVTDMAPVEALLIIGLTSTFVISGVLQLRKEFRENKAAGSISAEKAIA